MSETKWTIGPWSARSAGNVYAPPLGDQNSTVELVAAAYASRGASAGDNAHLISAAPDLYEALDAFVSHYQMGINPFLDDAYRAGRAALSRARGEKP